MVAGLVKSRGRTQIPPKHPPDGALHAKSYECQTPPVGWRGNLERRCRPVSSSSSDPVQNETPSLIASYCPKKKWALISPNLAIPFHLSQDCFFPIHFKSNQARLHLMLKCDTTLFDHLILPSKHRLIKSAYEYFFFILFGALLHPHYSPHGGFVYFQHDLVSKQSEGQI
ncbi:hypothetical protein AVEN_167086-1 [Araneus ventricosus]|uniref:Uncharacterized protein n=1 Tax=Araneus ventricosus TaxID=182803 RepID=A0A4Y2CP52_ARAVE|nr:hypothetical protein AVEN_167086-1 [Araneus ventricosus]